MEFTNAVIFYVNGKRISLTNPSPVLVLVDFLRCDLGLRGTKVACGEGGCGSCTVTVTKKSCSGGIHHFAVNACTTKICSLHLTSVTTIEGLGSAGDDETQIHPVQERIYKTHGSQCGFCTPGMVMSMSTELREKKGEIPDIEDVKKCLQGNLCRCTGYRPILQGFETFCNPRDKNNQTKIETSEELLDSKEVEFKEYSREADPPVPKEILQTTLASKILMLIDSSDCAWYQPTNEKQLIQLQKTLPEYRLLGGDTGWYQQPKRSEKSPVATIQLCAVDKLKKIFSESDGSIHIGSAVTLSAMEKFLKDLTSKNATVCAIIKALETLASPQVRNVATVGGNAMWDHPCSDLMTVYMATGCKLKIQCKNGSRLLDFDGDFLTKRIKPGRILTEVVLPPPVSGQRVSFFRKARRAEFDLAIANACFYVEEDDKGVFTDVKIAFGGAESLFKETKGKQVFAARLAQLLTGNTQDTVSDTQLMSAIAADAPINPKAPGQFAHLRLSLFIAFAKEFLDGKEGLKCVSSGWERSTIRYQKPDPEQAKDDLVTRPIPHQWAAEQACGSAVYVDDMRSLEGELNMVLVRSKRTHARIKNIDYSTALAVEGVFCSVDATDLPKEGKNGWGILAKDEPVFATETVTHQGQIVGALLCENIEAGRQAVELVQIEYKDLPVILSIGDARSKKADVICKQELKKSQTGLASSRGKTGNIKGEMHLGGQKHFYLEPHAVIAVPSGEKKELVIHIGNQGPDNVQNNVSHVLGLPKHKIVVKVKRIGGSFGGKERMLNACLASVAANKVGRPVRLIFSRNEDTEVSGHRHESIVEYNVDYYKDGRMAKTALRAHVNAGCSVDLTPVYSFFLVHRLSGAYSYTEFDSKATAYRTNTPSNTPVRGMGGPEGAVVIDTILDHIAHSLSMRPEMVREINLCRDGEVNLLGDGVMEGISVHDCWSECKRIGKYDKKQKEINEFNQASVRVKRGLSLVPMKFVTSTLAKFLMKGSAMVRIYTDGSVLLSHSGVETGQGLHTKMIQVASRALEIPHNLIHIWDTSTDAVANGIATVGSVGSDLNGPAVLNACLTLKKRLDPIKEANPDGGWKDWVLAAYLDNVSLQAVGSFSSICNYDMTNNSGVFGEYSSWGAGLVTAEVDCLTGDVVVLTVDLVIDVGKSLNPAIDIGQIEGGFVHGMGYATNEQIIVDPVTGKTLTNGPGTYKVPTASDIPKEFNVSLLRHTNGRPTSAIYSSKGMGEAATILGCSGVLLSVKDAVAAYRRDQGNGEWFQLDVPATKDKIRMAARDDIVAFVENNVGKVRLEERDGFEI